MKRGTLITIVVILVIILLAALFWRQLTGSVVSDQTLFCTDTDGGTYKYTKGIINHTVEGVSTIIEDSCYTSSKVKEYYCLPSATVKSKIYSCGGNPCIDGACEK